jgi:hypothetical protein
MKFVQQCVITLPVKAALPHPIALYNHPSRKCKVKFLSFLAVFWGKFGEKQQFISNPFLIEWGQSFYPGADSLLSWIFNILRF